MSIGSAKLTARKCQRQKCRWLRSATFVAVIACLAGSIAANAASQKDWHVSELSADVTVRPDGSLLVSEALTIPPSSDPNFGLRREIPIGSNDRSDPHYGPGYTRDNGLRFHILSVTVNGQPAKFRIDHYLHSFYQLIVEGTVAGMGSAPNMPRMTAGNTNTLDIVYEVSGAVRLLQDRDELYWNAVGHQLPMSFDEVRVRLHLPPGVPLERVETISYAGSRGASSPRSGTAPGITRETLSDGAAFAIQHVQPSQSISVVLSWPKGYITPPSPWEKFNLRNTLAPVLLAAYYILFWIYLRRNLHPDSIAAQYSPPQGMSPAAVRYIQTGGSDGTSLAAALADLTVKGFVSATATNGRYVFSRQPKCDTDLATLPPEEAELARLLFDPNSNVGGLDLAGSSTPREKELIALMVAVSTPHSTSNSVSAPAPAPALNQSITLGPGDVRLNVLIGVIQARLREHLQGKYFSWNFGYVAMGMLATFLFGMYAVAQAASESSSYFLLVWLFLFTQMLTALIATTLSSTRLPDRPSQWLGMLVGIAMLIGFPYLVGRQLADDVGWPPIIAVAVMIGLNAAFTGLLRTPTAAGIELKRQIAGYIMFLKAAEQDELNRLGKNLSSPPQLETLPYAIALGLKEAWGDAMAGSFAAVVAR